MTSHRQLRTKLVRSNVLVILVSFSILALLAAYGFHTLSGDHARLMRERAARERNALERSSQESIASTKALFEETLKSKGAGLLRKDGAGLEKLIEDNAFGSVRDFLQQNVAADSEILQAQFFVKDVTGVLAWQLVTPEFPQGLPMPIEYDSKAQVWKARLKGHPIKVPDAHVSEILKAQGPELHVRDGSVLEAFTPVRRGGNPNDKRAEILGYLRYAFSLEPMHKAVAIEEKKLQVKLDASTRENELALDDSRHLAEESLRSILLLLGSAGLALFFFSNMVSAAISRRITKPVATLTETARRMSLGDYSETRPIRSDDEIGILATAFEDMRVAIIKRDAELAAINADLERLVERRTAELAEEVKKVSSLLNNMQQAVFSVAGDGSVIAPVSRFTAQVFGSDLKGCNVMETVFSCLDRSSEEFSRLRSAFATVFGDTELQWDLMSDQFPQRLEWNHKILKIAYSPIWDGAGLLERLMLVIQDVTEIEKLERTIAKHKAETERHVAMIQQLADIEETAFQDFLIDSDKLLSHAVTELNSDSKRLLALRALHTVKGNARLFGFSLISGLCHKAEDGIGVAPDQAAYWLSQVRESLAEHARVGERLLRIPNVLANAAFCDFSPSEGSLLKLTVPVARFESLRRAVEFTPLKKVVDSMLEVPVKSELRRCQNMVQELAGSLGKQIELKIYGDEITLSAARLSSLRDIVVQLLRNSVDHGIELPADRQQQGKAATGLIEIECRELDSELLVRVKDDGRGFDTDSLVQVALARGLVSENQVAAMSLEQRANLAFLPGLSSKKDVTEVSGRGVGLDIVKASVEQLQGSLELSIEPKHGSEFRIRLLRHSDTALILHNNAA